VSTKAVTLDMSTAQPIQAAGAVKLDMSTAQPIGQSQPDPGFLDREIKPDPNEHFGILGYPSATMSGVQSVGRGVRGALQGAWQTVRHPIDTAKSLAELPSQVKQVPGAIKDINASPDPVGTYAKVGQETAGQGAGQALTALATEGATRLPVGKLARTAAAVAKPVASAAEELPVIGGVMKAGKALGKFKGVPGELSDIWGKGPVYPGAPLPESPGYNPGAPFPEHPGTFPGAPFPETPSPELLKGNSLLYGPQSVQDPAAGLGQIPVRGSIAKAFEDPGAPYPETPPKQVLQGSSLLYGPKPIEDPAAGLGTIPVKRGAVAEQMQPPQPVYPGASFPERPSSELSQAGALYRGVRPVEDPAAGLGTIPVKRGQLAESVQQPASIQRGSLRQMVDQIGNKVGEELKASPPPDPKQPIYQRGSLAQSMEGVTDLPQGHTPHQSSAMRSSMYDSGAKEFHARMTSGDTTYVYGDVAPEEAEAFNSAESKGKAYQQMKSGHPLVAKIVNGKRVAVKPVAQ
jgi:hypothetical protein